MSLALGRPKGALGQVLTLLGGAVAAQAVALAVSPLLTRLYGPEQFGVFALVASLVTLIATGATGRYELAIIVPADDADAARLARLALTLAAAVSIVVLAVAALAGDRLAGWAGDPGLRPWALLMPAWVALSAAFAVGSALANRRQAYRRLAASRLAQAAVTAAASVTLGAAAWGSPGLVLGAVLGQAVATVMLLGGTAWGEAAAARPLWPALKATAARYAEFPRINLPHALLDAGQASAVLALLGAAYGGAALGAYALALRVARTPLAMLGNSVGQVFQQRAARLAETGADLRPLVRRTVARLLLIAAPFAVAMVFAPPLFAAVFGARWRDAGLCALVLTPWMVTSLLTSPLSTLPLISGRQRPAFVFGLAYQAAMVAPLAAAWALGAGFMQALTWQSCCATAVLLAYGAWLYRLAGASACR
jgi:O-antigen/teichoic acid export membrane protein